MRYSNGVARWAIDLGTSNTGIARWDAAARRAEIVQLPHVARAPRPDRPLEPARMVPSMVELLPLDLAHKVGDWGWVRKNAFVGRQALIGCAAQASNEAWPKPSFTPTFKAALGREPTRPLVRLGEHTRSARDVARAFMRELVREAHDHTGERIRDAVFTAPIDSYDAYRAELRDLAHHVGIRTVSFVDEPVAAAMGYGIGIDRGRRVLLFDMGGGTLHAALVELSLRTAEGGRCHVIAKEGRAVGGNLVDRWLLEACMGEAELPLDGATLDEDQLIWQRLMLAEARRVKEAIHTQDSERLVLLAPEELQGMRGWLRDRPGAVEVTRARLTSILEARGLYALIREVVERVVGEGAAHVDEVLLVGGSTLLPGVFAWFEETFGRHRVRAWQPFEAVVLGAAAFAGRAFLPSDLLVHDYAILTHDAQTGAPQHTIVVPSGTRFPTAPDLWRRQLVPTCARGEPETVFKLVICEIGRNKGDGVRFGWDASGSLRPLGQADPADVVVPLNASNPTLGRLQPPHSPSDKRPRLDVSFGVDEDRWLIATIRDLHTSKVLFEREPVARLL